MTPSKLESLKSTDDGAFLLVKAAQIITRLNVSPESLLITMEFRRGSSIESLSQEYGLTPLQIEDAIREVIQKLRMEK